LKVDAIHLEPLEHIELCPIQQVEKTTAFTEQLEQPLSHIEIGPIQQEDKNVSKRQLDQPLVYSSGSESRYAQVM
jgi:hypothetical protein